MSSQPSPKPTPPSSWIDLDSTDSTDNPVHYVDHGGPAGAPLLVCVHGLGGSHANWSALAPLLTGHYRVLALDLAGFGLTAGRPRSTSVEGNRELLDRFLTAVAGGPAVLVGNSMGGLIAALQAARRPASVRALALIDPALPLRVSRPDPLVLSTFLDVGLPGPLRRFRARNRPPRTADDAALMLLRLCCAEPDRIPQTVIDEHIALARRRPPVPHADADLLLAARTLILAMLRRRRYGALLGDLTMPVLLLHGDRDRLVPIRTARRTAAANPGWRFAVAPGVGHVPMVEVPDWTASQLLDWLPAALEN